MADFGDIPMPDPLLGGLPIPISNQVHQGTELFHMVGRFFGHGMTAGRLHDELEPVVNSDQLNEIRSTLSKTGDYVTSPLVEEINGIHQDLMGAYQGQATDQMTTQFTAAVKTCGELGPKFTTLAGRVHTTQEALDTAWQSVKNYSRAHSDLSNVSAAANPFGGSSDDDKAEAAWDTCKGQLGQAGSAMNGGGSGWTRHDEIPSTGVSTNPPAGYESPGSMGPGPGHYGPGPGPGFQGPGPGVGPGPGPGVGPGPGFGPGYGTSGPGHGPGFAPGHYGGTHGLDPSKVGAGAGYGGGPGGAGLDTGSDLAGYSGGAGTGAGLGGAGDPSGLAGGGSGAGGGAGAAGAGDGAAGRAGMGGVPMGARGGGGSGNDSERERSTWLTEDDDIWGESEAPGGVIS